MAEPEDWMKPMDRRILELMAETRRVKMSGLWLKPTGLAWNIGADRSYVNQRLVELAEKGYVETEDGFYRISDQGYHYIQSGRP